MLRWIRKMARVWCLLMGLVFLAMIGFGCGKQEIPESSKLWVVMEGDAACEDQVRSVIGQFEQAHEGVKINLEVLPTDREEAKVRVEQLRTEIMAGRGPDVYLIPRMIVDEASLIQNVELSMRNGIFLDIGAYYDADDALDTAALNTAVMDAGVLDGARYILPLRYDIPVLYADMDRLREAGFDEALLEESGMAVMQTLTASGERGFSFGMNFSAYEYALNFFSGVIDYEHSEVTLTAQELAEFMRNYQSLMEAKETNLPYWLDILPQGYISNGQHWTMDGSCVHISWLSDAVANMAVAKAMELDLAMHPMKTQDGALVADVTFFGALGSDCADPALAYEFLRMFLMEEYQWENGASQTDMLSVGWPVRTEGCEDAVWRAQWNNSYDPDTGYTDKTAPGRIRKLKYMHLEEGDIPVLDFTIDEVRFPIAAELELGEILYNLNAADGTPAGMDIDAIAEELVKKLQWNIAEG